MPSGTRGRSALAIAFAIAMVLLGLAAPLAIAQDGNGGDGEYEEEVAGPVEDALTPPPEEGTDEAEDAPAPPEEPQPEDEPTSGGESDAPKDAEEPAKPSEESSGKPGSSKPGPSKPSSTSGGSSAGVQAKEGEAPAPGENTTNAGDNKTPANATRTPPPESLLSRVGMRGIGSKYVLMGSAIGIGTILAAVAVSRLVRPRTEGPDRAEAPRQPEAPKPAEAPRRAVPPAPLPVTEAEARPRSRTPQSSRHLQALKAEVPRYLARHDWHQAGAELAAATRPHSMEDVFDAFNALGLGAVNLLALSPGRRVLRVARCADCHRKREENREALCDFVRGFLAGGFEAFRRSPVDAFETKCARSGDPYCEFVIRWDDG